MSISKVPKPKPKGKKPKAPKPKPKDLKKFDVFEVILEQNAGETPQKIQAKIKHLSSKRLSPP